MLSGKRTRAKTHGNIDIFQGKVHQSTGGEQAQFDIRIAILKIFQPRTSQRAANVGGVDTTNGPPVSTARNWSMAFFI